MDLINLSASQAASLIKNKEISSVELTQACLDRINDRNDLVGAFKFFDPEYSLRQAHEADSVPAMSNLHGVPFGVKDVIDTADFPTERGTPIHKDRQPSADATCVQLMRKSGAVLLGKVVTTEYAMFTPNETRNPLNLAHTAGGSSSGTGAAVADKMVPIAFGNQTAGSLIRPAAFCGVYGLKPTHGTTDGAGILPLQPYFDTLGYMARSIEDLQRFYGVVTEENQTTVWTRERTPKIGFCETYQWTFAQKESKDMLNQTAEQFESLGVEVQTLTLPGHYSDIVDLHRLILYHGISRSLAKDYQSASAQMSEGLRDVIQEGMSHSEETYQRACQKAKQLRANADEIFGDLDGIICPSAPGEAPEGTNTGSPIFQVTWTLLGVPCINLPCGLGPKGLPVGVQLIGRRHNDAALLALANQLMNDFKPIKL